jgi:VIT family
MSLSHRERHRTERIGWLRATVLGANDGIVSTASLVLGVAAAQATHGNVLVAGVAGLVAGAMSMAAGEYVSVHSQADTEQADLALERRELRLDDAGEHRELTAIYVERGLNPGLAKQVADQLMAHDAIGAHARDELGDSQCATDSSCACVGRQLRRWSSDASVDRGHSPRGESDSPRRWNFTGVPRAPGWVGCARRWCASYRRRNARHAVGCLGDGSDCRSRSSLRDSVNGMEC